MVAMAPAIKLIDKKPGQPHRHNNVYKTFGRLGINIKKVHDAKGAFYVIVSEENLEKILTEQNKEECRKEGYELVPPLEYSSLKTVVVKQLDYMVDSFTNREIIESIQELNEWAEVEDIYVLPTASKMMKIRFTSQQMVQTALTKGVVVLHQYIPQWNVEREIFVRLNPCRNCFAYDHRVKDCPEEQRMRCTYCGENHKQADCKATVPKCINCGEAHRTLAAACKVRKELIKKRSKEIRERSRSRSRQGGAQGFAGAASYADAARARSERSTRGPEPAIPLSKQEMKDMLTVIMSAIVYGHYMEALIPGSFQENVSEVYRLNGLRNVLFPTPTVEASVMEVCREVFREKAKEKPKQDTGAGGEEGSASREMELESDLEDEVIERESMEIETLIKRHRESLTPSPREEKRKKEERQGEPMKKPPQPQRKQAQQAPRQETGAVPKPREGTRETEKETEEVTTQPRSRASSTSSQHSRKSQTERNITKEVGLTIYIRRNSSLNPNSKESAKRDDIRRAVLKGEAKFTWRNPKADLQNLMNAFAKNKIEMDDVVYKRVDSAIFDKINNVCTGIYGSQE